MQAAVDALQLGYSERQEVVDVAFRFLAKPRDCSVIVAGDLGVGLSTVHAFAREFGIAWAHKPMAMASRCFTSNAISSVGRHHAAMYRCTCDQ